MNSFPISTAIPIVFLLCWPPEVAAQSTTTCDDAYRTLYSYALDLEQQNEEYSDGLNNISFLLEKWMQSSKDSSTWNLMDQSFGRLGVLDSSFQVVNLKFSSQIDEMRVKNQTLDSLNIVFDNQIRSMKKLNGGKLILVGGIGFLLGTLSHRVFIRPRS